jgi:leucyl-tRNA synthetase, eubacterial and mitochondrial family
MNHNVIEEKWKKYWEENKTFETDLHDFSKPKYYVLDMFPYPSGAGLHAGHVEGYTATDIIARYKRMRGFNVLHPMGWDAFGLPAEQYAISTGNHPSIFTNENIKVFKGQLNNAGFSFDWDKEISTCDPKYYKWTQWIFKELYKDGLARKVDMPVNWCEELGTVLSNDEVIDGKSERGGYPVIRRNMSQWVIDMPAYAEKLLEGLEEIDWPESTKEMQRNWIGKSTGAKVTFKVDGTDKYFEVFTTRPDTLFGATYCVLSPEHSLVDEITKKDQKEEINNYKKISASKSELERTSLSKEKTGAFTGSYAINPVNNKKIPIWISDYVLSTYGTGAIMAVPAHDDRDYEFAKKYGLEIIQVLEGDSIKEKAHTGDGIHINSSFLDGLNKEEAIDKIIKYLEENNIGKKEVNYRLRDWIFARQRYWGEPIPIIHLENNKDVVLSDEELPLILPVLNDYKPEGNTSPLEKAHDWVEVEVNGIKGKRETSTMPGSAGSSWYYMRYIDPHNDNVFADSKLLKHWLPVDLYIGGPEHTGGHLLYSRMWNRYLYDKGLSPVKEPFKKLFHQGMILGANGIKMGKRYPEFVVNPNEIIKTYGADTLRLYEMFMGPLEADKPWSDTGCEASRKFIERVWRIFTEDKVKDVENTNLDKIYNQTVKKVTEDFEELKFNTAISQIMIFVNAIYKEKVLPLKYAESLVKLLNPICPFMTEEIWSMLGHTNTIAYEKWPEYDPSKLKEDKIKLPVSVNGKLRGNIEIDENLSKEEILKLAKQEENVSKYLDNHEIVKEIYVPNKILNIVIK